ncbi:MAG TPA: methyltransferase [Gemmatimonadota bacterium]|jgi:precorrin-6B methylase 2
MGNAQRASRDPELGAAGHSAGTEPQATYVYTDDKLGPAEPVRVETSAAVFQPTSTTRLLLRALRRHARATDRSALDLGCGCGIVAIVLRRHVLPTGRIGASDLSQAAVELARRNSERLGADLDVRCGSLFEPWKGLRFDLIVDDVSAVAEAIARSSSWYPPQVPSEAGDDGTRWITKVLEQAPEFLEPGGRLFFPVLTLADEAKTLAAARARFAGVTQLDEEWYPLGPDLAPRLDLLQELAERGVVQLRKRGSRWLWATKVFVASDPLPAPA